MGGVLQGLEELDSRVVCKVLVVIVVDLNHRGIRTCAEAFHLCKCEEAVWRSLAVVDTQCVFASLHDGIAVAEHAGSSCANLDVVLAHGIPVIHCVESGNFVYTHGRHLEYPCNLVHDADAAESVLALTKVEERHDGCFLVLRGVPRDDFLDELLILRREFEGNLGIVLGRVAVDVERAALIPRGARDAEGPPLSPLERSRSAWDNSAGKGYQS